MPPRSSSDIPPHAGVDVLSSERVWNGRCPLDIVRFRHRRFDGAASGVHTWELWRRGPAASVLPYDPVRDEVVLLEQFRLPALAAGLDPVLTEVPAGFTDPGETAESSVRRELFEETGLAIDNLAPVGSFLLMAGGSDEVMTLFVGRVRAPAAGPDGIAGHHGLPEENEDIRLRVWPAERAIEAAIAGQFANSLTLLALLWFGHRRTELRDRWR